MFERSGCQEQWTQAASFLGEGSLSWRGSLDCLGTSSVHLGDVASHPADHVKLEAGVEIVQVLVDVGQVSTAVVAFDQLPKEVVDPVGRPRFGSQYAAAESEEWQISSRCGRILLRRSRLLAPSIYRWLIDSLDRLQIPSLLGASICIH